MLSLVLLGGISTFLVKKYREARTNKELAKIMEYNNRMYDSTPTETVQENDEKRLLYIIGIGNE